MPVVTMTMATADLATADQTLWPAFHKNSWQTRAEQGGVAEAREALQTVCSKQSCSTEIYFDGVTELQCEDVR